MTWESTAGPYPETYRSSPYEYETTSETIGWSDSIGPVKVVRSTYVMPDLSIDRFGRAGERSGLAPI